jgi:hypothetical protein
MSESNSQFLDNVARSMQNVERQRFAKCGRLPFKKYFRFKFVLRLLLQSVSVYYMPSFLQVRACCFYLGAPALKRK